MRYPPHPTRCIPQGPFDADTLTRFTLDPVIIWDPILFWKNQDIGVMPCPWHGYGCSTHRHAWNARPRRVKGAEDKWLLGSSWYCEARHKEKRTIREAAKECTDQDEAAEMQRSSKQVRHSYT